MERTLTILESDKGFGDNMSSANAHEYCKRAPDAPVSMNDVLAGTS